MKNFPVLIRTKHRLLSKKAPTTTNFFSILIKDGWPNSWSVIGFRFQRPGGERRFWRNADFRVLNYKLEEPKKVAENPNMERRHRRRAE